MPPPPGVPQTPRGGSIGGQEVLPLGPAMRTHDTDFARNDQGHLRYRKLRSKPPTSGIFQKSDVVATFPDGKIAYRTGIRECERFGFRRYQCGIREQTVGMRDTFEFRATIAH